MLERKTSIAVYGHPDITPRPPALKKNSKIMPPPAKKKAAEVTKRGSSPSSSTASFGSSSDAGSSVTSSSSGWYPAHKHFAGIPVKIDEKNDDNLSMRRMKQRWHRWTHWSDPVESFGVLTGSLTAVAVVTTTPSTSLAQFLAMLLVMAGVAGAVALMVKDTKKPRRNWHTVLPAMDANVSCLLMVVWVWLLSRYPTLTLISTLIALFVLPQV